MKYVRMFIITRFAVPIWLQSSKMMKLIEQIGREGDSLGGIIEGLALNLPAGLGEPYFDTLEGVLAKALFAIPAVKGVEFGAGFSAAKKRGSENNDPFIIMNNRIVDRDQQLPAVYWEASATGCLWWSGRPSSPLHRLPQKQKTIDLQNLKNAEISCQGPA